MTFDPTLNALSIDVLALQAVVRALARSQANRSPSSLGDLLHALTVEADRLRNATTAANDEAVAGDVVDAWIEDLKDEAMGLHRA